MKNSVGFAILLIASAGLALAVPTTAPEIDASAGVSALALLSGALLVIRGRRKS